MSRFEGSNSDAQSKLAKLVRLDCEQLETRINEIADGRRKAICLTELEKLYGIIQQAIATGGVEGPSDGS